MAGRTSGVHARLTAPIAAFAAALSLAVHAHDGARARADQPSGQSQGPVSAFPLYAPSAPDDTSGFVEIFDGRTLSGWDGDPTFWRAESGAIVGESTVDKVVARNTFLVWRGGTLKDFELKVEFRISGANSGIQYRSTELASEGRWVVKGYQADIDFRNVYTGNIHEERGRRVLAPRGSFVRAVDGGGVKRVGTVGDPDVLKAAIDTAQWNKYHIVARGAVVIELVNGHVTSILVDEDSTHRADEGVLALQMHTGPPFKVEYRNLWYRPL